MKSFVEYFLTIPDHVRVDGLVLYFIGILFYSYLHLKHDREFATGLKGENGMWEAPEFATYYAIKSFPFILFGDAFLGFHLSTGMLTLYSLLIMFAIMGRAGVELVLAYKMKITNSITAKLDEPNQSQQTKTV